MNRHRSYNLVLLAGLLLISGCGKSIAARDADWLAPDSTPRGAVCLMHGWLGLGSAGMISLTQKLNAGPLPAHLYNENQWRDLARILEQSPNRKPLILIGHSYGADNALEVARELEKKRMTVDLIITLDPVTPPRVPGNVKRCVNIYQSNGVWDTMPWFRGIALRQEPGGRTNLVNWDIRKDRRDLLDPDTDHFNLPANEKVQAEILKSVSAVEGL